MLDLLGADHFNVVLHLVAIAISYAPASPIGWNRETEERSAGLRTFPLGVIASCGLVQAAEVGHDKKGHAQGMDKPSDHISIVIKSGRPKMTAPPKARAPPRSDVTGRAEIIIPVNMDLSRTLASAQVCMSNSFHEPTRPEDRRLKPT